MEKNVETLHFLFLKTYSGVFYFFFPPLKARFLSELKSALVWGQYIRNNLEVYVVDVYFKVILSILMPEESNEMTWNCFAVEVPGSDAFHVP